MVPTSLKVLGILGIILSALYLVCTPWGIFQIYFPIAHSPVTDQLNQDRLYVGFALVSGVFSFFLGILLLASSIGCLKAKPWARTGMNTYAVTYTLITIVGTIFNYVYLLPKMKEAMAAAGPTTLPPATFEILQIIGAIVGLLIAATIVTTILIIVNRKIAVDAFHGIFPADPTNFSVDSTLPPPPLP